MKYTKQEKLFLEQLGITPGPWEYIDNYVKGIFNPGGDCPAHVKDKIHGNFISNAPDMFLDLFRRVYKEASEKCTTQKSQDQYIKSRNILLSATGKPWNVLCKLWEACK